MTFYPPSLRYGLHPYLPVRLGYRKLVRLVNPDLSEILDVTDKYSLVNARNRTTLYREGKKLLRSGVPGDFVEIGVHRGGTAAVLAHILKDETHRDLHLFDRWGDLPDPTDRDGHRQEEYRKDRIPEKLAYLREHPPLPDTKHVVEELIGFPIERLRYHAGWYDDTLAEYVGRPIAFASIDCDYYESVKLSLAFVLAHATPMAIIIADDYRTWPGARTAVDEFAAAHRGTRLETLPTGSAILRLPA